MQIRTRQSIVLALSVAIALAVGATLAIALLQVNRTIAAVRSYSELQGALVELRFLTYEYLSTRNERSRLQWLQRIESLRGSVPPVPVLPGEARHSEKLLGSVEQMQALFAKIAANGGTQGAANHANDGRADRLGHRLLAISQDLLRNTATVIASGRKKIEAAQNRAAFLVIGFTATMVALMVVNWVLVRNTVLYPVSRLLAATETVAAGDLAHRTGIASADEVGQLAASFDRMTAGLQTLQAAHEAELLERRRAESELQRSNRELEGFAYVASHDLQEPLRMVVSYLQLIEQRYRGRLDREADEFIAFAVDGALRMRDLITDLLELSRVGTRGRPFARVDCNGVLQDALANLRVASEECGARIDCEPLPAVHCDRTQLVQLFQNLIGNALKFRGERAPLIRVGAERDGDEWHFSVTDNGIGIAPEHHERIFGIFQRLHTRREFPGTGIGLAICRKIAERHGGRITLQSQPGEGSTFRFSIRALSETNA